MATPRKYEINVETRFSSSGLDKLVKDFEQSLGRIAKAGAHTPQTSARDFLQQQGEAEREIGRRQSAGEITKDDAAGLRRALNKITQTLLEADAKFEKAVASELKSRTGLQRTSKDGRLLIGGQERRALAQQTGLEAKRNKEAQFAQKAREEQEAKAAKEARDRARKAEQPSEDDEVQAAVQERIAAIKKEAAVLRGLIKADTDYTDATRDVATRRNILESKVKQALAADDDYLKSTAQLASTRDALKAKEAQALNTDANRIAFANRAIAEQQLERSRRDEINKRLLHDPGELRARAQSNIDQEHVSRKQKLLQLQLEADQGIAHQKRDLLKSETERKLLEEKLEAEVRAQLAAEQAATNVAQQRAKVNVDRETLKARKADPALLNAEAQNAAATKKEAAVKQETIQRELAQDAEYIRATAAATQWRERQAAALKAEALGIRHQGRSTAQVQADVAVKEKALANRRAADEAERVARNDKGSLDEIVRRKVAEKRLADVIEQRVSAELGATAASRRTAGAQGALAGTGQVTAFQRLQATLAARQGGTHQQRAPGEFQTLGQFTTSKLITTAGFAASGALLYGGVTAIKDLIQEAEELERIFNQIRAQFESIGEGEQFHGVRDSILSIAKETGAAADEIAFVFFQLKGAFTDTQEAMVATEQAMKLAKVTGLELSEVVDSFTAIKFSFDNVDTVDEIGDKTLGLQERFGVLSKETIKFAADLAPVAQQVGLEFDDLAALGAAAQRSSGRPASALSEAFGRILPTIVNVKDEIISLYSTVDGLSGSRNDILKAFATGNSGDAFKQLVEDYDKLNAAQQGFVIETLGGRREAQALIPILENSSDLVAEWSGQFNDAGKSAEYFADLNDTVANTMARVSEQFKQIGEELFESGLSDVITGVATAVGALGFALAGVAGIWGQFNDATNGGLNRLLIAAGLAKGLAVAFGGLGKAIKVVGAGLATSTKQHLGNTAATIRNKFSKDASATATLSSARASQAETGALSTNTAAQSANANAAKFNAISRAGAALPRPFSIGAGTGSLTNPAAGGTSAGAAIGVAVAGGLIVNDFYQKKNNEIDDAANKLNGQLAEANIETLRQLEQETTGFWDRVAIRFFGQQLPEDAAQEIKSQRISADGRETFAAAARRGEEEVDRLTDTLVAFNDQEGGGRFTGLDEFLSQGDLVDDPRDSAGAGSEPITELQKKALDLGLLDDNNKFTPAGIDKKTLDTLIKGAEDGDQFSANIISYLNDSVLQRFNFFRPALERISILQREQEREDQIAEEGLAAVLAKDLEDALSQFEEGDIDDAQVRAIIEGLIRNAHDEIQLIENLKRQGHEVDEERLKELQAQYRKGEEALRSLDLAARQRQQKIGEIVAEASGSETTALDQDLQSNLDLINSGLLTPDEEFDLVPEIIEASKQKRLAEIEQLATAEQRIAAAKQGYEIPEEARQILIEAQLGAGGEFADEFFSVADQIITLLDVSSDQFVTEVATLVLTERITVKEAMLKILDEEIARLESLLLLAPDSRVAVGIQSEIDRHTAEREAVAGSSVIDQINLEGLGETGQFDDSTIDKFKKDQEKDRKDAEKAMKEARDAYLSQVAAWYDLMRALADGDPLKIAALNLGQGQFNLAQAQRDGDIAAQYQAQTEIVQAQQEYRDAVLGINNAFFDLFAAQHSFNPVSVASAEIAKAQQALATAQGEEARLNAQAQLLEAQRQMQQAQFEIFEAQRGLLLAMANAAGDTVEASKIQLGTLQEQLRNLLAQGAQIGDPEVLNLQAQIATAQAAVRDAKFADRMGDIDFLLQMEKITSQQAIEMLQSMLQIPELTEEQVRNIQAKIKGLQDELSGDFQFNLPTNLQLPTLYEARRLNQSTGGYQDNRNVTITINASNGLDLQGAQDLVAEAVSGTRFGTQPRRY